MRQGGRTGVRRSDVPWFGGLAVAQAQVAVARRPAGERRAVAHDASGMATRVDWGQTLPPPGGCEQPPGAGSAR